MLGLDQVEAINVGAAPTPVEVLEFFHAIGLPLAELWGMSETCGAGTRQPARRRSRSAPSARPRPGVEIKLDTDGEVLIRSEVVMLGYRNLPEKTAEAFTDDGWMRTGDIGEFDEDGLPDDRRPQEGADHQRGRQEHVAGQHRGDAEDRLAADRAGLLHRRLRPYNTALIVLDADFAPVWAAQQGIEDTSLEALARDERVRAAVQDGVDPATRSSPSRTDQEVHDRRGRLAARRRRADADDEAQAQADRREVHRGDRGHVRGLSGPRARRPAALAQPAFRSRNWVPMTSSPAQRTANSSTARSTPSSNHEPSWP